MGIGSERKGVGVQCSISNSLVGDDLGYFMYFSWMFVC